MKHFFTLAILLAIAGTVSSQNFKVKQSDFEQIKISFTTPEINTENITLMGSEFSGIVLDGFAKQSVTGKPALPSLVKCIEVPLGNGLKYEILNIVCDTLDGNTLGISLPIAPAQPSRSKSDRSTPTLVLDNATYASNMFTGEPLIDLEEIGIARNRNLATVTFNPISWNPLTNQIAVVRSVTVAIRQKNADRTATMRMKQLYASPEFGFGIESINHLGNSSKETRTTAPVRYTIVANSMFRGALDEFADWKRRKGFMVDLVYTDEENVGSTTTSISRYLKGLYDNATETEPAPTYVLLVGDVAQIPAFLLTAQNTHYSDLNYVSWTTGDNIPDCYIGRFSAQNLDQLTPQISKTLMYEQYTFPDDSYLSKGVLIAGVDGGRSGDFGYTHADPTMDYVAKNYINSENGFTNITYYKNNPNSHPTGVTVTGSSQSNTTASALRNLYNSGVGFVNYSAHGDKTEWSMPSMTTSHVQQMTNQDKPMVAIGNCCLTNSFQVNTCLGEAFLRKGNNAGAVGYIGGSEVTYWNEDVYWSMGPRSQISASMSLNYNASNTGMYDQLFHTHGEDFSAWHITLGAMLFAGNMSVQNSTSDNTMKKYYWEIYHLMGDPSLMPYIHGPAQEMSLTAPGIVPIESSGIEISCVPYAYVALTDDEHNLITATYADSTGNAILSLAGMEGLQPGLYEIAASAQGYKHKFVSIAIQPTGTYVKVIDMTPITPLEAGKQTAFDITLKNQGIIPADNIWIEFRSADGKVLIDTTGIIPLNRGLAVNEELTLHHVCSATVWNDISDQSQTTIHAIVRWAFQNTTSTLNKMRFIVNAPDVVTESYQLTAPMDSTFTTQLTITSHNIGSVPLENATATLVSLDPSLAVSVNGDPFTLDEGETVTMNYTVTSTDSILPERVVPMIYTIATSDMQFRDSLSIIFGNPYITIDFEDTTMGAVSWNQGNYPWELSTGNAYEGNVCARSKNWNGYGGNNKSSEMSLQIRSSLDDSISFYYRVSSEESYDKFSFYIDNVNKLEASGEIGWTRAAFFVPAGTHTFRFAYAKDSYVERGEDAAFIDLLKFPNSIIGYIYINDTICSGTEYTFADTVLAADDLGEGTHQFVRENSTVQVLTLTVLPAVQATIEGGDVTIKAWETVRLTANGGIRYQWNNGETHPVIDVFPNETTTYTVTAYNGRCTSEASATVTVQGTLGIDSQLSSDDTQIKVYPNPAKDKLTVDGTDIKGIVITDIVGRVEIENNSSIRGSLNNVQIDIQSIPNGIHIIQVTSNDGRRTVKKFVKK